MLSSLLCLPLLAATTLAQASYPPKPKDLSTPYQQRLAIKGPNSISVGWNTYQQLSKPCVAYGTSKSSLDQTSCSTGADSITYPTSRTWFNTVILSDLQPATLYYYKIESTNSTADHFRSPRSPGDATPFTINTVIDLGVYGEDGFMIENGNETQKRDIPKVQPSLNHTTIGRLAQTIDDYELILHPGDYAYADDWFEKPKNVLDGVNAYEAIIEQFFNQLSPISGRIPYAVSPGNHEADCQELAGVVCPEGQKNFTDIRARFGSTQSTAFPSSSANSTAKASANRAASLANPPFWFSFDYGLIHVVFVDTETDFKDAPDGPGTRLNSGPFGTTNQQLDFLEADLASVDRSVTPWIIFAGHRPWYSTGGGDNVCQPCQDAFEGTLYKYGVDVAVFGHVHNSQLFTPTYNNTADPAGFNNPKAPLYIVSGGTGNIEGLTKVGSNLTTNRFVYADDFSYAQLHIQSKTSLGVEFIRSSTGESLYTTTLIKNHTEPFVRQ